VLGPGLGVKARDEVPREEVAELLAYEKNKFMNKDAFLLLSQ